MPIKYSEVQVRGQGRANCTWKTVSPKYMPPVAREHYYTHLPRLGEREADTKVDLAVVEAEVDDRKRGEYHLPTKAQVR